MQKYSEIDRYKNNYLLKISDIKDKPKISFRDIEEEDIKKQLSKIVKKEKIKGKKLYSIPYNKLWFNVLEEYSGVVIENNNWNYTWYISFDTKHQKQFIF